MSGELLMWAGLVALFSISILLFCVGVVHFMFSLQNNKPSLVGVGFIGSSFLWTALICHFAPVTVRLYIQG